MPCTMRVSQHEKDEWSRMAQRAYAEGRNAIGHRYSVAASVPSHYDMPIPDWDRLMYGYRQWLVFTNWGPAERNEDDPAHVADRQASCKHEWMVDPVARLALCNKCGFEAEMRRA